MVSPQINDDQERPQKMEKPRFKFKTRTGIYGNTDALRNKLLSRSFQLAAEDRDGIRQAVRNGTPYVLPLTATRPAAGWKNRLKDFADAAWDQYIPSINGITTAQVKASQGYKGFYAAVYDMGYKIDDITTESATAKGKAAHTVAKLKISARDFPQHIPAV